MKILVIVEHDNKELKKITLNCVTAAKLISDDIEAIVMGYNCKAVVDESTKISGLKKVNFIDNIFAYIETKRNVNKKKISKL